MDALMIDGRSVLGSIVALDQRDLLSRRTAPRLEVLGRPPGTAIFGSPKKTPQAPLSPLGIQRAAGKP
jgi:hypothetical protein